MITCLIASHLKSDLSASLLRKSTVNINFHPRIQLKSTMKLDSANCSLKEKMKQHIVSSNVPFFSAEFFPPQTTAGIKNVISRIEKIKEGNPMFCDITWHGTGNPEGKDSTSSLSIADMALNICGLETMSHITCVSVNRQELDVYLNKIKKMGITNILVLRGDISSCHNKERDFQYAADMVRYIRSTQGDYFTIGVGGYPAKHPEAASYEDDIRHLKNKVDCGADFIITQFFFESHEYINFVNDCRSVGIKVPIIAGIMPIQSFGSLKKLISICGLKAPNHILEALESIADNKLAVKNFGIDYAVDVCTQIMSSGLCPGFHFYTLNNESSAITVLKRLGLWKREFPKQMPWRVVPSGKRSEEQIRPIFWTNRLKSYLYRTSEWEFYPHTKWDNYILQEYKPLDDHYFDYFETQSPCDELRKMWESELSCEQDVWNIFNCFYSKRLNRSGYKVLKLPWIENGLNQNANKLSGKLGEISLKGFLPINSQKNINGLDSSDEIVGWGTPGGLVYQKAYLELFTSRKLALILKELLPNYPFISYRMISNDGKESFTNISDDKSIAITWGVFPGKEIIQPTVVDPKSFEVWSEEAFRLWILWKNLYTERSESQQVVNDIINDYFLVSLVDNQFPKECRFWQILDEVHLKSIESEHFNG